MFYIYANGKSIYQPMDDTLSLFSPKLTLEMGKAGSLQFSIPPNNKYYNSLQQLTTVVTVEMDDIEIFRGRVLTNTRNFNNIRTIYCEGDLAYLVDSVQKGEKYEGKVHDLFRKIIATHNARVEATKRFTVGKITVENRDVVIAGKSEEIEDAETGKFDYKQIAINSIADEWQTSFDYIESCLINYVGGYLRTRRSGNITYIDYLKDYDSTAVQEIEFGKNMLDLTEEISAEDVFTVLIPLGDENLTIASINNGSDELVDAAAVSRYGRIVKTHVFDSVTSPNTLLENGKRYLASNVNVPVTITVKAVDMHLVDPNTSGIFIGNKVHVNSVPHDLVKYLTCTRIEYDMENPANNTYTFGSPKQSLTERYRKDKNKSDSDSSKGGSAGGGSAGGAAAEDAQKKLYEIFDAWINCDPEAGHISLGALYEKYQNDRKVLVNQVGIDLDAPSGQINIKNLRSEFDDLGNEVKNQAARIDLINNETGARIDLVAAYAEQLAELENAHYASLTIRADANESAIEAKADKFIVDSIQTTLNATKEELTETKDVLTKQCGIVLDASGTNPNVNISTLKKTVDAQGSTINENTTNINSISTSLSSLITLEAKHKSDTDTKIAAIEVKANKNESSISLKADKTTLNSKVTTINSDIIKINGKIETIQADLANVETLIANRISSYFTDTVTLRAGIINVNSNIRAGGTITGGRINATSMMTIQNQPVATQAWVNEKYASFATQSWVESKGYLTEIPDSLSVGVGFYAPYVRASKAMTVGGAAVATQAWVTEQLKSYAKSDHTHSGYASSTHSHGWSSITGKPATFKPASHKHKFSLSLANGHTHKVKVGSTTYTTQGVSTNITHKYSGTTESN